MPFIGETVSSALRTRALRDIERVLSHGGSVARATGDQVLAEWAGRPFTIAQVSDDVAARFMRTMHHRVVWANEWNCFNRALLGAHTLNGMTGVGLAPTTDAFAAGIAIQEFGADAADAFHAAVALRLRSNPAQVMVYDPLPPRAVEALRPLEEWAMGNPHRVIRPWAGTGIQDRPDFINYRQFDFSSQMLSQTWHDAGDHQIILV